jgi:hypothetical protein
MTRFVLVALLAFFSAGPVMAADTQPPEGRPVTADMKSQLDAATKANADGHLISMECPPPTQKCDCGLSYRCCNSTEQCACVGGSFPRCSR